MLYRPHVDADDRAVIELVDGIREQMRFSLRGPRRWYGTLRRATFARAVQGSNSIEGYHASVEDVAAVIEGEEPLDTQDETRHAITGYRDAMTYVMQLATAPSMPALDESLLKALHFMMLKYDLSKRPGQWRPGGIWVENEGGAVVYTAPDREHVEDLVAKLVESVNASDHPPMIRAAMAHLNLALIHPFSDGNGRMARCLQTFVLASDGVVSPEFASIEEYLGRNTPAYYDVLTEVAEGAWTPRRSTRPWIRFCLTAHYRQAVTLLWRIREFEALWDQCEQLARSRGLPDRAVGALTDAARGWRLRRSLYVKVVASGTGDEITHDTATRDLRAMAASGLVEPIGEKRARQYAATPELAAVWQEIRSSRPARGEDDPYALVAARAQPALPGLA